MYQLILILHVTFAIVLIGLVLIQQGKGADIGASFGAGASNTVFGSQGTGSFLFRLTGTLAMLFFATSILLSYTVSVDYRNATKLNLVLPQKPSVPTNAIPVPKETGTGKSTNQ